MRRLVLCCICLCMAASLVWARDYSSMKYDMVMEQGSIGSVTTKVYVKGNRSRMEMQAGGMQTINLFDGTQAYMYIPSQNMAMVVPIQAAKAQLPVIGDYSKNCDNLGEEMVDGRSCSVYNCAKGGQPVKMWIDKELDFPLKTITGGATVYYKNIEVNVPLDDSLFVLPEGVKAQDMSTMMQGLGGGIPGQ